MDGLHLTADLGACAAVAAMGDAAALRGLCLAAVREVGLTPVGEIFHRFPAPGGVTGVVLLAESHLAVHTWPERSGVTLDAYVCNLSADNSAAALALIEHLIAAFAPQCVQRQQLQRCDAASASPAQY
jgi:S-adenosylmethionine decarboxylase